MIHFLCPKCGAALAVPEAQGGKNGKCFKCGQLILVPGVAVGGPVGTMPASAPVPQAGPGAYLEIPKYTAVKIVGYIYIVLGILSWALGAIVLILTIISALAGGSLMSSLAGGLEGPDARTAAAAGGSLVAITIGLGLFATLGFVIVGILSIGMGQVFFCVRDMAQNSFLLRKL